MTLDYEKAFKKFEEQLKRETEWAKDYEKKREHAFEELVDRGEPKGKYEKKAYHEELREKESRYWFAHGMLDTYEELIKLIDDLKDNKNFQKEEA